MMTKVTIRHPDCIKHDLHQSIHDPGLFMFYENWINKKAHEEHVVREEVQT